jgi:hypothetical protein
MSERIIKVILTPDETKPAEVKPWWEKYNLFVTFFLTTIVGTAVTTAYQTISSHNDRVREVRHLKYNECKDFFVSFSEVAERRSFFLYKQLGCLEDITIGASPTLNSNLLAEMRIKTRAATEDWNLKWNFYRVMVTYHMGEKEGARFYKEDDTNSIVHQFRMVHSNSYVLLARYDAGTSLDVAEIRKIKHQREVLAIKLYEMYGDILAYLKKISEE